MSEVGAMLGRMVHPDEPLLTAGIDSRGGMELRQKLASAFGMQLPVTLLYDHQTVAEIVEFACKELDEVAAKTVAAAASKPSDGTGRGPREGSRGTETGLAEEEEEEDLLMAGGGDGSGWAAAAGANRAGALRQDQRQQQGEQETLLPSPLLKVLRPAAAQRPLFLAAPGVANAQVGRPGDQVGMLRG